LHATFYTIPAGPQHLLSMGMESELSLTVGPKLVNLRLIPSRMMDNCNQRIALRVFNE
jgi:hypothetical protein